MVIETISELLDQRRFVPPGKCIVEKSVDHQRDPELDLVIRVYVERLVCVDKDTGAVSLESP